MGLYSQFMMRVFKRWSDKVDAGRKSAFEVSLIFVMVAIASVMSMWAQMRIPTNEFKIITIGILGLLGLIYAITLKIHDFGRVEENAKDWIGDTILALLVTYLTGLLYLAVVLDDPKIKEKHIEHLKIGLPFTIPAVAYMLFNRIKWTLQVLRTQRIDQSVKCD